jgi:hypothetical protein
MNDEKTQDQEFMNTLKSVSFTPESDDQAFLGAVRHRVTVRKRQRVIRNGVLSSVAVLLLVVAIINKDNLFQPGYGPLLNAENMAMIGWSDDELTDITANYDELFSFSSEEDELIGRINTELVILFDDAS